MSTALLMAHCETIAGKVDGRRCREEKAIAENVEKRCRKVEDNLSQLIAQ